MRFKNAVEATPEIAAAWRAGLQSLENADKRHVDAEDTKRLAGSIALDSALAQQYPHAQRWDYGIGHQPSNRKGEIVYWVEVHPASDREVNLVLAKLQWLQKWLRDKAPNLWVLRKEYVWVSSGRTSFTLSSPQQKQFALLGLEHKGRLFRIPSTAAE